MKEVGVTTRGKRMKRKAGRGKITKELKKNQRRKHAEEVEENAQERAGNALIRSCDVERGGRGTSTNNKELNTSSNGKRKQALNKSKQEEMTGRVVKDVDLVEGGT